VKVKALLVVVLAASLAAGCITGQTKVSRSEFEDIPVPRGLSFIEDRATVIESPSVKAARLMYRGRIEMNSLGVAMRTTLEANGWRSVSNTTNGSYGITQVLEKNANSLQVRLWEGWWFTYVELTASRALQIAK